VADAPSSKAIGEWAWQSLKPNEVEKIFSLYNALNTLMRGTNYDLDGAVTPYVDPFHHALTVLDEEHSKIHQSKMFNIGARFTIADAAGVLDLLGVVPAGLFPHFRSMVVSLDGGPFDIDFYEGTTVSALGTELLSYNANRNSAAIASMLVYSGPTVTTPGTLLEPVLAAGTRRTGATGGDGSNEWILKESTNYMIRITNNTGGGSSSRAAANMFWYE